MRPAIGPLQPYALGVDLSAFPTRALLRWDLALRLLLSATVPVAVQYAVTGDVLGPAIITTLVAALTSMSNLGPDVAQGRWVALALIGAPIAMSVGVLAGNGWAGGLLFVFVIYTIHGICLEAGLLATLAWFPISALGLVATVLSSDLPDAVSTGFAAAGGSAWAGLLMLLTAKIPQPSLPIPREVLTPEVARFQRLITHPTLADWFFPFLLGSLAVIVLVVTNYVTSGFKPYWAVFALVAVLGPAASKSKRDSWEVVLSALAGVLLSFVLLSIGMPPGAILATVIVFAVIGGLVIVKYSLLSKTLITPFSVIIAAAALGESAELALGWRVGEYAIGAGVGLAAAIAAEAIRSRIVADGPPEEEGLGE